MLYTISTTRIQQAAKGIRRRVLEYVIKNNGGYLSQACSPAEILASLYLEIMNLGMIESPIIPPAFSGVPSQNNPDHITGAMFKGTKGLQAVKFMARHSTSHKVYLMAGLRC